MGSRCGKGSFRGRADEFSGQLPPHVRSVHYPSNFPRCFFCALGLLFGHRCACAVDTDSLGISMSLFPLCGRIQFTVHLDHFKFISVSLGGTFIIYAMHAILSTSGKRT
ncbi:hypothetical protein BT69DRAFT_1289669, partial [Atractiella rhizophila]